MNPYLELLSSSFRRFVNEGHASLSTLHPALDLDTTEERVESNDHDQAPLPFRLNDDDPGEDVEYVDIIHDSLVKWMLAVVSSLTLCISDLLTVHLQT